MFTAVFSRGLGPIPTLLCPHKGEGSTVKSSQSEGKARGAKDKKGQEGRQSSGEDREGPVLAMRPTVRWRHGAQPANAVRAVLCSACSAAVVLVVCCARAGRTYLVSTCTWDGRKIADERDANTPLV